MHVLSAQVMQSYLKYLSCTMMHISRNYGMKVTKWMPCRRNLETLPQNQTFDLDHLQKGSQVSSQ